MIDPSTLPYRPNVGAALFNAQGLVFVARRADMPNAEGAAGGWQLPQGGIDDGEDPELAVLRELEEEIGTRNAVVVGEHPEWLTYDLPPDLLGRTLGGRYRGQRQRWFALRFTGRDGGARCAARTGGGVQAADLRNPGRVIPAVRRPRMMTRAWRGPGCAVLRPWPRTPPHAAHGSAHAWRGPPRLPGMRRPVPHVCGPAAG